MIWRWLLLILAAIAAVAYFILRTPPKRGRHHD